MHFSMILIASDGQTVDEMMMPFMECWEEDDPLTVEYTDEDGDTY